MSGKHPLRKEILPLAGPQMKIVYIVCVPLVVTCLLVSFCQTYFFLTSLRAQSALQTDLARRIIPLSLLISAISLLVVTPVVMAIALYVSHRIVGALQRLAREMELVGAGRLTGRFILRNRADLRFLPDAFNEMKDNLQAKLRGISDAAAALETAAAEMDPASSNAGEILAAAQTLRAALNEFELAPAQPAMEPLATVDV